MKKVTWIRVVEMEAGYVIKLDIFEIRDYGFADCLDV